MNQLQVAKVAYEADRALSSTHGEPDRPSFEALSQHDKDELAHRIDAALIGRSRGVTPTVVARQASGAADRQRAHLFAAIIHALAQHEDDIRNPARPLPTPIPVSTQALSGPPAADSGQAPAATLPPPQSPPAPQPTNLRLPAPRPINLADPIGGVREHPEDNEGFSDDVDDDDELEKEAEHEAKPPQPSA